MDSFASFMKSPNGLLSWQRAFAGSDIYDSYFKPEGEGASVTIEVGPKHNWQCLMVVVGGSWSAFMLIFRGRILMT